MNGLRLCLTTLTWVGLAAAAWAQPNPDENQVPVDPAVHKLDAACSRMVAYLNAMPTFQVKTKSTWNLDGPNRRVGGSQCTLNVRHPGSFHLQVGSTDEDAAVLECASDGTTLTRLYHSDGLAIYSQSKGDLEQLLEDAMTDTGVKASGLDLLMRPDPHTYLMASLSQVKDHGEQRLGDREAHHFSATWFDGSRVDFWIAADRDPVLLRWKRTARLDLGDSQPHELQTDSVLTWEPNAEFTTEDATVDLPDDAIRVKDLQTYLLRGGTDQLRGQPAPSLPLTQLNGAEWDLTQHRGKQLVVLLFFATWAVPSTQDMPAVLEFIRENSERGVVFYAINVGESRDDVRAFVDAQNYTHPVVLDEQRAAARAYRVTSLPVTVLIGKDGTVQAAHVGTSAQERALIREDMAKLLKGESLASTSAPD